MTTTRTPFFNQAMAAQQAQPAKAEEPEEDLSDPAVSAAALAYAAAEAAESEELLEEIELDLPGDEAPTHMALDTDDFDIDALVAQTQAAAPVAAVDVSEKATPDAPVQNDDDFDIDSLLAMTQADAATAVQEMSKQLEMPEPAVLASQQFDSSELEAFAESLADEQLLDLGSSDSELLDGFDRRGEATSVAEQVADISLSNEFDVDELMATEDDAGLIDELDEILNEVAEIRAQSLQTKAQLSELDLPDEALALASADFAEAELTAADVSAMLDEKNESEFAVDVMSDSFATTPTVQALPKANEVDSSEPDDFIDIEELMLDESSVALHEAELAAESAAELEYLSEFAELDDALTEMPDLQLSDDNSVARVFEGISSVERPSKELDEYPELQLDELDLKDIFPDSAIDSVDMLESVDSVEQETLADLDQVNFDELLSGLDDFTPAVSDPVADQHKAAEVLAELEQLQQSQSQGRLSDDDEIGLPDFVNIDKLLAATEDQLEPDAASRDLNIDVGLADFEDLIAADEVGDVDNADSGFAGQLDLVRAYIEIGDADSANHLIKEIMASDAPAHVKQEASGLSA